MGLSFGGCIPKKVESLGSLSLPSKQETRFRMSSLSACADLYRCFKIKHAGLIVLGGLV